MDNKFFQLDVVQFRVKSRVNVHYVYVEVLSVPTVCCLIRQNIKSSQEDLELADYSDGTVDLETDVLIGIDFYYSFVSNKIIRGKGGPVADESCHASVTHTLSPLSECEDGNTSLSLDGIRAQLEKFWTVESVGDKEYCGIHELEKHI